MSLCSMLEYINALERLKKGVRVFRGIERVNDGKHQLAGLPLTTTAVSWFRTSQGGVMSLLTVRV